jgi:hypothetical protein
MHPPALPASALHLLPPCHRYEWQEVEGDASGDAKGRLGDAAKEAIKEALVGGDVGRVEGGMGWTVLAWLGLVPLRGFFSVLLLLPLQSIGCHCWIKPALPPCQPHHVCPAPCLPAACCR